MLNPRITENLENLENFAQGDGAKLRLDLRKFFSRYGMKVRTWISKSVEWIFLKICVFDVLE